MAFFPVKKTNKKKTLIVKAAIFQFSCNFAWFIKKITNNIRI